MKVILADDHALFRDGFALLLKQLDPDIRVLEAANLREALAQAEANPDADLLLLDLAMPGMAGVDSVSHLLEVQPDLPVVILSASESRELVDVLMGVGVSGFIPKSSTSAVMLSALRLVLAGGLYIPPQFIARPGPADEHTQDDTGLSRLTERQLEILRLVARGWSNKQICRELGLGEGTVKAHLHTLYRNLGVANRTEAAGVARRLNLA